MRVEAGEEASSSDKGALLRLRLPLATAHYLLSTDSLHVSPRLKALLSLSDEPIEKLDQGVLLERALRLRLAVSLRNVTAIHRQSTWADALPVLAGTRSAFSSARTPRHHLHRLANRQLECVLLAQQVIEQRRLKELLQRRRQLEASTAIAGSSSDGMS